jgi:hypothetical protein
MRHTLSRRMPPWLAWIGWPERRFGLYARVFVFLLVVLAILRSSGMDVLTAVGWLTVTGSLTIDVCVRLAGPHTRVGQAAGSGWGTSR